MTDGPIDPDFMAVSRLLEEIEALHEKARAERTIVGALEMLEVTLVMKWPQLRDTLRSLLSSRESVRAHTDHPVRHWDRTCPACIAASTAPERIYLQDGCDDEDCDEHLEYEGVTWCSDRIHDKDTEYVRADLFAALAEKLKEAERERDEWQEEASQRAKLRTYWKDRAESAERRIEELDRVLRELVRLKDLTDAGRANEFGSIQQNRAWDAARAALKEAP